MVVFLDLDKVAFADGARFSAPTAQQIATRRPRTTGHDKLHGTPSERSNPNVNSFSAALACYP
jgi:hypothetical protein